MPSANVAANAALVIGLLSPLFMALMPNYKWLFGFLLTVGGLFAASLGIIGAAVDAEAAKPNESLDAQLGYAINFWEVVTAASLVAVSTAVSSEAKMRLLIIAFLLSFTPPAAQADDLLNPATGSCPHSSPSRSLQGHSTRQYQRDALRDRGRSRGRYSA